MTPISRRLMLQRLMVLGAAPMIGTLFELPAYGAAAPLSESDPTAQALGYRSNVKLSPPKDYPSFAPGQNCSTCAQSIAGPDGTSRICSIFPGKLVNSGGWCKAYAKKTT